MTDLIETADLHRSLRQSVGEICQRFPDPYWRDIDAARAYPEEFVKALTEAGYLAALIPPEYGGSGLGISEAAIILEEINRCGGNSGACHAQMYIMGSLLRHGSEAQKRRYLPGIADGDDPAAGVRRVRADDRLRHDADEDARRAEGRSRTSSTARRSGSRARSTPT